jgi:hypothetical protein
MKTFKKFLLESQNVTNLEDITEENYLNISYIKGYHGSLRKLNHADLRIEFHVGQAHQLPDVMSRQLYGSPYPFNEWIHDIQNVDEDYLDELSKKSFYIYEVIFKVNKMYNTIWQDDPYESGDAQVLDYSRSGEYDTFLYFNSNEGFVDDSITNISVLVLNPVTQILSFKLIRTIGVLDIIDGKKLI